MLPACAGACWAAPTARAGLEDALAHRDSHTAPGQTSRCPFAELQGCPSSTGGRPWTNTVPTPLWQLGKSPPPTPVFIESLYTSL